MRKIEVEIEGQSPLLMHSPKSMFEPKGVRTMVKESPEIEAEKYAYRMKDGDLYVPSTAIFGAIMNGSSFKKAEKYSFRSVIAGNIRIEPNDEIPLGTKNYTVDIRTIVNQQGKRKSRIIIGRPKLDKWKLNFTIVYNDQIIIKPEWVQAALEDAGVRVGLLAFSPRNSGSFGTFKINKFKVI